MTLNKTDLAAIEQIVDRTIERALKPVKADISAMKSEITGMKSEIKGIHEKLDKVEKWLPLENTYLIDSLKNRTKNPS